MARVRYRAHRGRSHRTYVAHKPRTRHSVFRAHAKRAMRTRHHSVKPAKAPSYTTPYKPVRMPGIPAPHKMLNRCDHCARTKAATAKKKASTRPAKKKRVKVARRYKAVRPRGVKIVKMARKQTVIKARKAVMTARPLKCKC